MDYKARNPHVIESSVYFISARGIAVTFVLSKYIRLKMYAVGYTSGQFTSLPLLLHKYTQVCHNYYLSIHTKSWV